MRCPLVLVVGLAACISVPDFSPSSPDASQAGDGGGGGKDGGGADAQVVSPPSCQGLAASCGVAGTDDCCARSVVPASAYFRAYDGEYGSMAYPATVRAFALDTYEVTVARFRKFLDAGQGVKTAAPAHDAGSHPWLPGTGWQSTWNAQLVVNRATLEAQLACGGPSNGIATWSATPGQREAHPIVCVTWYEAMAFCAWDGGFLPTETEWNAAAAGGSEQRVYPWSVPPSSTAHPEYANTYEHSSSYTQAVGARPNGLGRWGHHDLAGNAYEMLVDFYNAALPSPCTDCVNLTADGSGMRSIRGGSYLHATMQARGALRYGVSPWQRTSWLGFRCARAM